MDGLSTLKLTIFTIILIVFSDAIGQGVLGCPAACLCYVDEGGLRTANCTGVEFIADNKYNKVFHEIGVLNIETDNDVPIKLWDDMFISFTKLKFLSLQNCGISYLPKSVFKGLKKVFEINLSSNDIKHFDIAIFENIYALNKLNLRGNRIQGSSKPLITSSSLRELDLGYCGITNLQNEFFHGVKKLARLYMDGNHLQTVREHILPSRITHLNLANNGIINVPISTINSLSQLRVLNLGANPINCTCALMNLQDILSGHATIIEGDLICAYPPELENMNLSKVNENEVCNKETFNSRYHFKKSQIAKYTTYPKKEYYFENEKYNPFEIQGDDPGTSMDDYPDGNENNYDDAKPISDKKLNDETKDEDATSNKTSQSAINSENQDVKKENAVGSIDTEIEEDKHEVHTKQNPDQKIINVNSSSSNTNTYLTNESPNDNTNVENAKEDGNSEQDEKSIILSKDQIKLQESIPNADVDTDSENERLVKETNEDSGNETTDLPPINEEDVNLSSDLNNNNISDKDGIDEGMKTDQVLPVGELHHSISYDKVIDNTTPTEKEESGSKSDASSLVHDSDNKTNVNTMITRDHEHSANDNKEAEKPGKIIDTVEVEGSGAGLEEIATVNTSIPIVDGDDALENLTPDISEEPIDKQFIYPDENQSVRLIVEKKPIDYEEMGPIIVVACIIVFITILVFVALYRGFCKSNDANRKPVNDVEANNSTELHDITSSLLPKSPVNEEKHNDKYPNETTSPETVNLIKSDKTDEMNGHNHSHDLNQNDNKNETIIKNGKHLEDSPAPIEKTKAKLTVLLDSIPRTPIFLQKRPTTLNNG